MCTLLINQGVICSEPVVAAMKAVDRGFFIDLPAHDGASPRRKEEEVRYLNAPYRNGVQHLSAPGIYGIALEALDLGEGLRVRSRRTTHRGRLGGVVRHSAARG